MAALLVVLAVMSVLSSVALPAWRHAAQREREAELIFRGEQYARAIMLYQRRTPGAYPPDVETLVEGRFLRRAYRDPMTADGRFRLVRQSELAAPSGAGASDGTAGDDAGGEAGAGTRESPGVRQSARPFGDRDDDDAGGVDGNVVGVASRSERTSIALYKGKSKYSEWVFVAAAGAAEGGSDRPGPSPPDSSAARRGGGR